MFAAFCADLWLVYEAYRTHSALWRAGVGLASALVVLEGVSVAFNYRDAAFKIAGPDPGKWRTMRNSPYPSSPGANRIWAVTLILLAITCAARGIAA